MSSRVQFIRKLSQLPLAIVMIAVKSVVEFFDFILDHTNTPIANLVDVICLDLLPELGQHAVMLMGAALHSTLYRMYLVGIELFIPALGGLLMFGAEHLSPVFASITVAVIPPLSFAVPYLCMGIGGLVVLNQLVCLKKIFTTANSTQDPENNTSQTSDRLELMRSRPTESGLKILQLLLNPIVTFPDFLNEAYAMACSMKTKIASVLWPWYRTKEPLIIKPEDVSNAITAGLGQGFPLEELDPQLIEQMENTDTKQPLMFHKVTNDNDVVVRDMSTACKFESRKIVRRHSYPAT